MENNNTRKIDLDKVDGIVIKIDDNNKRQTKIVFFEGTTQHEVNFIPDEVRHEEFPDKINGEIVIRFRRKVN